MNIQSTHNLNVTRPAFRNNLTSQVQQAGKEMNLSNDEEQMIGKQFKAPSPRVLELYSAKGETRLEQPQAKGNNIDFTV